MQTPRHPVTGQTPSAAGNATTGDPSQPARPRGAALVRIGWMLIGSVGMVISVMTIAGFPAWTFSLRDGVFWGAVVATGILRYWDATRLGGENSRGEPTTPRDLQRYLGGLAALSVMAWVAAQSVHL